MTNIDPHVAADNDNKDQKVLHIENGQQSDDEKKSLDSDALNYFTPAEQKKIIHRLDRRLVTVVGVSQPMWYLPVFLQLIRGTL